MREEKSKEYKTLTGMINLYCRKSHSKKELCPECTELLSYAKKRLELCPYNPKPKCKVCKTHCYNIAHRDRIKEVMKFSGMYMVKRGRIDLMFKYYLKDKMANCFKNKVKQNALFVFIFSVILSAGAFAQPSKSECITCHKEISPIIVEQWKQSNHSKKSTGCYDCHKANKSDKDAFEHNGFTIATIVSPKDCGSCHKREFKEQQNSRHADAASFIGSLDNTLGEIVEGGPAAASGCKQCHGSTVKVLGEGRIDPATWPNGGIGRVNPDGSKGSCTACHYRHNFSLRTARHPDTCGRCHMGPDHPQREIYGESKHGINFMANIDKMNLGKSKWVLGKDYSVSPNCITCHMGATTSTKNTHDVGERISWTLRPAISIKVDNSDKKRENMQQICLTCHSQQWVTNFYMQYDNLVNHYNDKFGKPAKEIMDRLLKAGKITKTPFDDNIEWIYYELWHHEGRRARMGASMMGPDFTQWHGMYEVAKHFYTKFIPDAEKLLPDVSKNIMDSDLHKWKKGLSKEDIKKEVEFYQKRYKQ